MSEIETTHDNGTIKVATFKEQSTGRFLLTVVHTDSHGEIELLGDGYASMDEAKSAAWGFAQTRNATFVPTKRRVK